MDGENGVSKLRMKRKYRGKGTNKEVGECSLPKI